jgi:hypothetical protein
MGGEKPARHLQSADHLIIVSLGLVRFRRAAAPMEAKIRNIGTMQLPYSHRILVGSVLLSGAGLSLRELATPDLDLIKQVEQECRTATNSDFAVVAVNGTAVGVRGTARQGRLGIVHDPCPPRRRGDRRGPLRDGLDHTWRERSLRGRAHPQCRRADQPRRPVRAALWAFGAADFVHDPRAALHEDLWPVACRKILSSPAAPNHEFGYYRVRGLDTIRGEKEVARAAGILGSAIVAAGFEPSVPRVMDGDLGRQVPALIAGHRQLGICRLTESAMG